MTQININQNELIFRVNSSEKRINLESILKIKMYNKLECREFFITDFSVGSYYPSGRRLRINFTNLTEGLVIPVSFSQDRASIRISIHSGEIIEQFGIKQKILEISLLPDLMASKPGDEGYFILPIFSGAIVDFKTNEPVVTRDRIYMEQTHWEKFNLMNCFALNHNENGILGIVTKGDFFCWVTTELNQGGKNRIYPTFGIRHHPGEPLKQDLKEVIYHFSTGKNACYPVMAKTYRDYLINERGVSPLKERIKTNPVLNYSVNAMRVKIFMGLKYPYQIDGSTPMNTYTTFQEAEIILDEMKQNGIKKAVITLVGWNLGGHDGAYPTRFPVEPELGGEQGLAKLIKKAVSMGYQIVPHDNVTDVYRSAPDFDYEYTARTEYNEALPAGLWGGGQSFKACPVVYLDRYGYEFSRIKELGFSGHYYLDAQSTVMWQCHDKQHPADEEQFALSLARITQLPREMFGAVSVEAPSAFCLPFIDEASRVHSMAAHNYMLKNCPENTRKIIQRGIPFYQIAVHGLITYQDHWVHTYRDQPGGVKRGLLAELAFGARPSMEVSYNKSPNGDFYKDSICDLKEAYETSFEKLNGIHVEMIEDFEELSLDVVRVKYANGTSITVNFGDDDFGAIKAYSICIK